MTNEIECACCYTYLDGNGECPCMWVDDCPDEQGCEMRKVRKYQAFIRRSEESRFS
jgi:hypothetical protein